MDRIDILGHRPDRHKVFTKELLSQTDDKILNNIVRKAAEELGSPMAIVNIVMDRIQFFKSSYGLPPLLRSARGTHRDISFCQYVVKDEAAFKIENAQESEIPQSLVKEFGINSYLGVPIQVDDIVIGALCVLDTEARQFTDQDIKNLGKLSKLVNKRLKIITENRRHNRLEITENALLPGIRELVETMKPIQDSIHQGYENASAIRAYLEGSKYLLFKHEIFSETTRLNLEAADEANKHNTELLSNIELAVADMKDCVDALKNLTLNTDFSHLSDVVIAAQDLSRNSTKLVGGFTLPSFPKDPLIYTKNNIAVAIVTNCLLAITNQLQAINSRDGIDVEVVAEQEEVKLIMIADKLSENAYAEIKKQLRNLIEDEPNVTFESQNGQVVLIFDAVE